MPDFGEGAWWRFAVAALAAWRVTHFAVREDGPFAAMARIRAASTRATGVLDCFYCASLWVCAIAAAVLASSIEQWLWTWLALSGAVCLIHRASEPAVVMQPMEGASDGMLWPGDAGAAGDEASVTGGRRARDDGSDSAGQREQSRAPAAGIDS